MNAATDRTCFTAVLAEADANGLWLSDYAYMEAQNSKLITTNTPTILESVKEGNGNWCLQKVNKWASLYVCW